MYSLTNPVMPYAWGSTTLIQRFTGRPVDGAPAAEMWIGAHPLGTSSGSVAGRSQPLDAIVGDDPRGTLGDAVVARFGDRLPFLTKLLAAAAPLSIQVHPDSERAKQGFHREEERGIPIDDPRRTYKDEHHKPELVYALTRFEMLSGLREPEQAAKLVEEFGVVDLEPLVRALRGEPEGAWRAAFEWLLGAGGDAPWVAQVARIARERSGGRPEVAAVARVAEFFPGDPTVLAPVLLNHVWLEPGQAVFTGAGVVHAYLEGLAIEVMAASDNVLRAGLTPKHIDRDELMRVARLAPGLPGVIAPTHERPGVVTFACPVADFSVAVLTVRGGEAVQWSVAGPRVAVCVEGAVEVRARDALRLETGGSAFIPCDDGPVTCAGSGTLVVAYVPEHSTMSSASG